MGTLSFFRAIAAKSFAAIFVLCLISSPPVAASEVRIAVSKTPLSLPFFVALEKGMFQKYGVSPTIINCVGGVKCLQLMLDGKSDLSTCSELPVVFNAFQRKDYSVLASFVTNKKDMKFIVAANQGASKPSELKRLKVGVVRRSASQYFFDVFMLYKGVDPSEVEQVGLNPAELPEALATGKVDAVAAWEPFGYLSLKQAPGSREIKAPNLYTQTFNLVGNKSYVKAHEDEVLAILRALSNAIDYINSNAAESKQIMMKELGLEMSFIDSAWSSYRFELSLRQSLITTMVNQAKWASSENHVPPEFALPNMLDVVNPTYLRQMEKSHVDFSGR